MSAPKVRLYNPTYQVRPDPSNYFRPKQISSLRGKSVVIMDNQWWVWEQTLPVLREALINKYGAAMTSIFQVPRSGSPPVEAIKALAKGADCAIVCLAVGAPELLAVLEDAVAVAKAGLPTVCIVVEDHMFMWNKYAGSRRVTLPVVTIPGNPEALGLDRAREMMEGAIDRIVEAFQKSPPPPPADDKVVDAMIEVPDSLEEMQRSMYSMGWTDGLPVIPPTEERVKNMLVSVNGSARDRVGELPPLRGRATLGNVAANAVMAGCSPEHMPVLLAQVRACSQIEISLPIGLMNNSGTLISIVNGPIRKMLDVNCARGVFGPGRQSNAALGRALQFMVRNIGGAMQRVTASNFSQPGSYTFCFGENEEQSPWEPLHVEKGFSKEESTVTVTSVTSHIQVATYTSDWKTMLDVFAEASAYYGSNIILQGAGELWVFITPHHAAKFSEQGFSKSDVKEYIWEKARFPKAGFPEKLVPYPHHLLGNDEEVFVVKSPNEVNIVVVGAPALFYGVVMTSIPTPAGQKMLGISKIT